MPRDSWLMLGREVNKESPRTSIDTRLLKRFQSTSYFAEEDGEQFLNKYHTFGYYRDQKSNQKIDLPHRGRVAAILWELDQFLLQPITRKFNLRYHIFGEAHCCAKKAGSTAKDPMVVRNAETGKITKTVGYRTSILLRVRIHPTKGDPRTEFLSKGTLTAILLHEIAHLRHMNHGKEFMLFLKELFLYASQELKVFNLQMLGENEIPSPWEWENEIYKSEGRVAIDVLERKFAEHLEKQAEKERAEQAVLRAAQRAADRKGGSINNPDGASSSTSSAGGVAGGELVCEPVLKPPNSTTISSSSSSSLTLEVKGKSLSPTSSQGIRSPAASSPSVSTPPREPPKLGEPGYVRPDMKPRPGLTGSSSSTSTGSGSSSSDSLGNGNAPSSATSSSGAASRQAGREHVRRTVFLTGSSSSRVISTPTTSMKSKTAERSETGSAADEKNTNAITSGPDVGNQSAEQPRTATAGSKRGGGSASPKVDTGLVQQRRVLPGGRLSAPISTLPPRPKLKSPTFSPRRLREEAARATPEQHVELTQRILDGEKDTVVGSSASAITVGSTTTIPNYTNKSVKTTSPPAATTSSLNTTTIGEQPGGPAPAAAASPPPKRVSITSSPTFLSAYERLKALGALPSSNKETSSTAAKAGLAPTRTSNSPLQDNKWSRVALTDFFK